ncbi:bcl-2-like protein 11 isoform X6 [Polypterus senegalus]|uniref:bcl-2-like protein 11 isoform X6 n=1 Tax=Polypterus senegalus TaxID=55291 RepID=UPI0019657702|nr:bcl-2-like protein 11 isoform X6 [Polypterus senegalus]
MARPPSDLNSESGAGDGGPLQPTQGAGRPLSRPGPRTHSEGDQSGEVSQPAPNSLQGGLAMPPSPHPYASRFPLFSYFSRSSSGYYSFESGSVSSLPSMTDKFTQTPSLSSQAIRHAQQWLAQEYEHYQGHGKNCLPYICENILFNFPNPTKYPNWLLSRAKHSEHATGFIWSYQS